MVSAASAMKRIRKPIDKEIQNAVVQTTRRKVSHSTSRDKASVQHVQSAQLIEVLTHSIEWQAPSVTLSSRDRASQLILSEDQMTCKGVEVQKPFSGEFFFS